MVCELNADNILYRPLQRRNTNILEELTALGFGHVGRDQPLPLPPAGSVTRILARAWPNELPTMPPSPRRGLRLLLRARRLVFAWTCRTLASKTTPGQSHLATVWLGGGHGELGGRVRGKGGAPQPDADTFKKTLLGSPRCSCIFHVDVQDLCETNLIASNTSLPGYCCECMCSTLRLAFLEGCKLSRLPLRSVHFPSGSRHNSSGVPVLLQIVLHYDLGSCIFLMVLG